LERHLPEIEERIQMGVCEMTGLPFNFHSTGIAWNSPSIHRRDPKMGYTYKNIQIVCFGINAALGNWGEAALKEIVNAWLGRDT
jgi:hypothetical protein